MKISPILLTLAVAACGGRTHNTGRSIHHLIGETCLKAVDFGAISDDGLDDRVALQAAIDAAIAGPQCLELASGVYHVTRQQGLHDPSASLRIAGRLELRGAGAAISWISLLGTGQCADCQSYPNATDWHGVSINGPDIWLHDLGVRGDQRTQPTADQTHLIQVDKGAARTILERMEVRLPEVAPSSGGDCIRLLGQLGDWIEGVTIRDVSAPECDRSFLGVQRAVQDLLVERVQTFVVGDQAIDIEPTGGPSFMPNPIGKRFVFRNMAIARGPSATGDIAMAIHGDGAVLQDVRVEDSTFSEGGIQILDTADVAILRLHLKSYNSAVAPLYIRKRATRVRVVDTTVERRAQDPIGNAIKIAGQNGAYPTSVLLSGVTVLTPHAAIPIFAEDLSRLTVEESEIVYTGEATLVNGIRNRGIDTTIKQPVVIDTVFQGNMTTAAGVTGLNSGPPVYVRVTGP